MMKRKSLLQVYCMEGSITGLKYFYRYSDVVSRCYWAIGFLLTIVFASFMSISLWSRFSKQPTVITIETIHANTYDLPYPSITLCSPVQIAEDNVEYFKKTLVEGNTSGLDFEKILPYLLGFYYIVNPIDQDQVERFQQVTYKNRYVIQEIMSKLAQSCDTFLRLCIFESKVIACDELFRPILTDHGLCCIFNSPYFLWDNSFNNRGVSFIPRYLSHSYVPGSNIPVTVVVDTQAHTAYNGSLLHYGGIKVLMNDWTEFPSEDDTFISHLGVELHLSYDGVYTYCTDEVVRMYPETRQCVFPEENDQGFVSSYYRNSDCDSMCTVSAVRDKCNCIMFSTPGFRVDVCNATDIECIVETKNFTSQSTEDLKCDCPRDCDYRKYNSRKFSFNLHEEAIPHNMIINRFENIVFNKTSAIIHIAPESIFYQKQKQETVITLVNLLSNIGGVFGICLGCSVLSILEFLFFIYKSIRTNLQPHIKKCRRKLKR